MTASYKYQQQYILDKAYYLECFDQSVPQTTGLKPYTKAIGFIFIGTALLLTDINAYASWFIIGLGFVEGLSVRFKRAWWLWRQLMSKASGHPVNLTIDETGIHSHSDVIEQLITWEQIEQVTPTSAGMLLKVANGSTYLSNKVLDDQAIAFIHQQTNNTKN
ncbi:YcxB family protein [Shewanella waksmanii]|uniref:YcxB family protein n=1 Tax=Shewanella waksmanii TaxID=213783 RepID=UPI00373601E3